MDVLSLMICSTNGRDQALQHTLAFGIGIHHAGLAESDRNVVEALFEQGKIQVRHETTAHRTAYRGD